MTFRAETTTLEGKRIRPCSQTLTIKDQTMNKTAANLLLMTLILIFAGCGTSIRWRHLPETKNDEKRLFVVSHGWHTGIIVSGNDLGHALSFLKKEMGHSPFYELGWGDRGFYQAKKITAKIAVQSILWPTRSVMHVAAVPQDPALYFSNSTLIEINTSSRGLGRLIEKMASSFKKGKNGKVIKLQKGIYGRSFFFEGVGTYHMANTCNTWTAVCLNSGGVPVRRAFSLTASSIMKQSRKAMAKYRCCVGSVQK